MDVLGGHSVFTKDISNTNTGTPSTPPFNDTINDNATEHSNRNDSHIHQMHILHFFISMLISCGMLMEVILWEYTVWGTDSFPMNLNSCNHFRNGLLRVALNVLPAISLLAGCYSPWISMLNILYSLCSGYYIIFIWTESECSNSSNPIICESIPMFRSAVLGLITIGMVHNGWIWRQQMVEDEKSRRRIDGALEKAVNLELSGDEMDDRRASCNGMEETLRIPKFQFPHYSEDGEDTTWDNGGGLGSGSDAMNLDSDGL